MKGRNRDTAWYAIVDADWPEVREAFEVWLAPDNFVAGGRQRAHLQAGRRMSGADDYGVVVVGVAVDRLGGRPQCARPGATCGLE